MKGKFFCKIDSSQANKNDGCQREEPYYRKTQTILNYLRVENNDNVGLRIHRLRAVIIDTNSRATVEQKR